MGRVVAVAVGALLVLAAPAGAVVNDFSCKPSAQRPVPVVVVHGTFGDSTSLLWDLHGLLEDRGYCVFSLDYGNRATAPSQDNANEIAAYAHRVLEATKAPRLSFVGHSQGGMLARYVTKSTDLLTRVQDVVGLAPSSHGTETPLAEPAGATGCPACADQAAGSEFIQRVNAGEEAPGPASYTVISTRFDWVVIPVESQAIAGPPERVTNVLLQDRCPTDVYEHLTIPLDPVALQWTINALERSGPANPRFEPDCSGQTLGRDPDPASGAAGTQRTRPWAALRTAVLRRWRGRVSVPVRCSGPSGSRCSVRVRLFAGRRMVARRSARVGAGRTLRVSLRLSRFGRRTLVTGRRARVTLTAANQPAQRRTYVLR